MEKENTGKQFSDNYSLVSYNKILTFPNLNKGLIRKLKIRQDMLITKHSIEKNNTNNKCEEYLNYLDAEIKLISFILTTIPEG